MVVSIRGESVPAPDEAEETERESESERGSVCIDRAGAREDGEGLRTQYRSSTVYASRFHQVGNSMIGFSPWKMEIKKEPWITSRVLLPSVS